MHEKSLYKSVATFLIMTLGLTYVTGIVVYMQGGLEKQPMLSNLLMFFPAIVAFTVIRQTSGMRISSVFRTLGFRLGNIKYFLLFPLIVIVIISFTYFVTYLLDPNVFISAEKISDNIEELDINLGTLPVSMKIIIIFLINGAMSSFVILPLTLGEEIGWRAFLYPRLVRLYKKRGLFIGGIIWGVWHAPMIMMGHNYPSSPVIGLFVMTLWCIPTGILLYYIYCRSGSVVTVALVHAVMNQTAPTINMLFVEMDEMQPLIHGPTGLIGIFVFSVIAFVLYRKPLQTFT